MIENKKQLVEGGMMEYNYCIATNKNEEKRKIFYRMRNINETYKSNNENSIIC